MKKSLCLLLVMAMVFALAACGGKPATQPPTTAPLPPTTNPPATNPPGPVIPTWDKADALPVSGTWVLGCDVTVTKAFILEDDLTLELNGFTVTRTVSTEETADQHIYTVPENLVLTITENSQEGKGGFKANYAQGAKCVSPAALLYGMAESQILLTGGIYDASLVESVYVAGYGGAIYTDGKLVAEKASVLGYKNTAATNAGCGTALGAGERSELILVGGTYQGGGTTGSGGVIASKGKLTIERGVFGLDPNLFGRAAQDASLILMTMNEDKTTQLTINGGAFNGVKVYEGAGCIYAGCPVTITGGEFYGAEAKKGGILYAADTLEISGGYFFGVGKLHQGDGGLIYATGPSMTITGGEFKMGGANGEGTNIYYSSESGTVTLGGEAMITGGVTLRGVKNKALTLKLQDKVIVDKTNARPITPWSLRLEYVMIYLNDSTDQAGVADKGNTDVTLTYDSEGNVTGFTRS